MSWLDELGKIVTFPGALISGTLDQIGRRDYGDKICLGNGNVFHAVADLKDNGIDAYYPVPLSGTMSDLRVRRGKKKEAMKKLREWGYECW